MTTRRPTFLSSILLVTLAGIFAVFAFWKALFSRGRLFPGLPTDDAWGTQWFFAFVRRYVAGDGSLWHTDLLFWPWGKDLYLHTGSNLLDAFLVLPLRSLFGTVEGYGIFLALGLAAGAWSFARLVREFVDDEIVVGGSVLLFVCSTWPLAEVAEGRPTQALLFLVPLFLRDLLRTGSRPGLGPPFRAGLLLALLGYQYWFYGLFGALLAFVAGGVRTISGPERTREAGRHLLLLALAFLAALPGAGPLLEATGVSSTGVPGLVDPRSWTLGSVDSGTDFGLLSYQPWTGRMAQLHLEAAKAVFLDRGPGLPGWLLAASLLLVLFRPGRLPRAPFLAIALAAVLVAIGPWALFGGLALPNPVYILLAVASLLFRRLWWPDRALAFLVPLTCLALAVLGDQLVRYLRKAESPGAEGAPPVTRWHGLRQKVLAVSLVGGALAVQVATLVHQGLLPMPAFEAGLPAVYRCLADPGGPVGAVIELPFGRSQAHLWYQALHGRPILGGMLENQPAFQPPQAVAFRTENRFVAGLISAAASGDEPAFWPQADFDAAGALGYRYVVLLHDAYVIAGDEVGLRLGRSRLRRSAAALTVALGAPLWEDGRASLWAPWGGAPPCDIEKLRGPAEPVPIATSLGLGDGSRRRGHRLR
jgi:hypothetical protein